MGLRETFQTLAQTARQSFGNMFEAVDYLQTLDAPTLNAGTGVPDDIGASTPVAGTAAFVDYTESERARLEVAPDEDRCLVAALDLAVVPKAGDLMRRASGQVVEVAGVNDAGGAHALWDLRVRNSARAWPVP
jgi:hypothetical protein